MTTADLPDPLRALATALQVPGRVQEASILRPGRGARPAAVLVLIGPGPEGPEVLFVERAATMRSHASQIAFPGGAADDADADPVETALREAEEETGLDRSGVRVLGQLPAAHVAVSGFDVTTVVGWWQQPSPVSAADPREVAAVHLVAVRTLVDPARRASVRHPSGYTGPAFSFGDHLVWGLSAYLLDAVLDLAGWQQPWDRTREVPIPARYLSSREPAHPDTGGPDAH